MSFCQSCGAKLEDGSRFCTNCGAQVVSHPDTNQSVPNPLGQQANVPVQPQQPMMSPPPRMARQKSAQPSQPNPIEEFMISFSEKLSSFMSLQAAMIIGIVCQVLDIIYNGNLFHFSGALEDLTYFFTDNVPFWLWKTVYEFSLIYLFMNVVAACYRMGMRSWLLYVTPILWAASVVFFDIAALADMGYEDFKWIGRMVILSYIFVLVLGFMLSSSRFSWLGKVTIVTAILWIISSLATESLLPSLLSILSTIYWAIVVKTEVSKFYYDVEEAYYQQFS